MLRAEVTCFQLLLLAEVPLVLLQSGDGDGLVVLSGRGGLLRLGGIVVPVLQVLAQKQLARLLPVSKTISQGRKVHQAQCLFGEVVLLPAQQLVQPPLLLPTPTHEHTLDSQYLINH